MDPFDRLSRIRTTPLRRRLFFIGVDALLISASVTFALFLRFDWVVPQRVLAALPYVLAIAVVHGVLALETTRVYRSSWAFMGLRDMARVVGAVALLTLALMVLLQVGSGVELLSGFPRSVALLQAPFSFVALAGFRLAKRIVHTARGERVAGDAEPTLLVGAGDAGAQVVQGMLVPGSPYRVVGFVDDDPLAKGQSIHGVPVLGPVSELERLVAAHGVKVVVVCVASATSRFVRDVVHNAKSGGATAVRIVPAVSEIIGGRVDVSAVRDVSLADLLGREAIEIDSAGVKGLLKGKRVIVTGGAGTIGSELCRQIARFKPARLVILDVDESRLHDGAVDLRGAHPDVDFNEALVDVRDARQVSDLMRAERPDVVFHAAAYKHVPMMEKYPLAALEANVLGTHNVAAAAEEVGCKRFVLISTDKAVDPSSIMGASKRLAEFALFQHAPAEGRMIRSAVRFGNVIGSRGSVIPIFERQIKNGGPVTVTHPDMERFFMMTSEAVSLVLQAASLGQGGDLFVLDMGKPVRIHEVAKEFIRLNGLELGRDIEIVFTGLRPGEKLVEVLHYENEQLEPTEHRRIMRARVHVDRRLDVVGESRALVESRDAASARAFMNKTFPTLEAWALEAKAVSRSV